MSQADRLAVRDHREVLLLVEPPDRPLELGQPATRTAAVAPTIAQAYDLERSLLF
jgi:hypothetical protein